MDTMSTKRVQGRLDYINSQEPGDESQATAMDIVDRLIMEDDIETSEKISTNQISRTKSACTLGTKVAQCLAKRTDCSSPLQKPGAFDWFDTPNNDECASSIMSRKKQRIHANTQVKHLASQTYGGSGSGTRTLPECTDDDSGVDPFKKREPVGSTDDLYEAYDIGPCTQMAAEAMEALSNASTVNYVVREKSRPESSVLRTNSGKGSREDKICPAESPIQKRIGGSSSFLSKRPSKTGNRKNPKKVAGKVKISMNNGIIHGTINHEVSEGTVGSGADDSNILSSDAVIHPKRKRTYMFVSGTTKVQFNKASRSPTLTAEGTEVADSSTAKTVGTSVPDLNQLPRLAKHSTSVQKDHESSLTSRVPLRELNNTGPKSRTRTSEKRVKKGLVKSPGSRELASLFRNEVPPILQSNRRRRSMSKVRVLFSQSMDKETIKLQTKILIHFGLPVATTISEATHFVAEKFARTRNMLEAIATGIPIVTPSWLECCGEARCFIDEKKYILRDLKKEKELGFSMPVSLSRACQNPLLEGRRVLITPNAKPSKELLKSLVVAAHGQPLEKITVSMMSKNFKGAFVISCEQDHRICMPLIKKGFEVFDSELLLNGIVIQKLEFERYRLFCEKAM
ncbi:hypothetical protein ACP70R_036103 [Stipagrostis hirtigluma subsp. patula]